LATTGCGGPGPQLAAADGRTLDPLFDAAERPIVLVFLSHECPIANAVAPTLAEAAAAWGERVAVRMVHVDPDLDAAAAMQHATDYALPGEVLLDPRHALATRLAVRRTPEAVVWHRGAVRYRGAIDDQWTAIGSRAQAPSRHYLRDAVAAVLADEPVTVASTDPVGCLLPEPAK
jgi:thiol-disulfide isomerase/thioredoxin